MVSKAKPAVVKAAPVVAVEVDRSIPADIANKVYHLGSVAYNPRAVHNSYQWDILTALLEKAGDKGVPGTTFAKSLANHNSKPEQAHFNFISYLERRSSLRHTSK